MSSFPFPSRSSSPQNAGGALRDLAIQSAFFFASLSLSLPPLNSSIGFFLCHLLSAFLGRCFSVKEEKVMICLGLPGVNVNLTAVLEMASR